jgi:L-ascorbate metabolism protein UlaG (beta-lactamase superfamily)
MNIRRLGWAGVELESAGHTAVIDLLEDLGPMQGFVGEAKTPLPPAREGATLALVTHLHGDHTDPTAIARALDPDGGVLLRPAPAAGEFLETAALAGAEKGLEEANLPEVRVVEPWQTVTVGPFTATAVPAVDGFGDPQVSWIVEAGGVTVFHGGDTTFHGSWWLIAMRHGPVDVAFLPCNGPVCDFPHRQPPSPLPAALTPEQAAAAAHLLQARLTVPIHYGTIEAPPVYAPVDDATGAFERAATTPVRVVEPGEQVDLEPAVSRAAS